MAGGSQEFTRKIDSCNDAEVEAVLSQNKISPNLSEKTLSPILGGSNKKFLSGRKLNRKKTARVKLSDRFKENTEEHLIINPINLPVNECFNASLSPSQGKSLIDHLDKLEELDNKRKDIHKILVRDDKSYNFKKPAPVRGVGEITGRHISISERDIKKQSILFEGTFPTNSYNERRESRDTFLIKRPPLKQDTSKSVIQNKPDNISQSLTIQTELLFAGENFDDIELYNEDIQFKKASCYVDPLIVTNTETNTNKETVKDFSLTQEICNSGISNTQMIKAFASKGDLIGFSSASGKPIVLSEERLKNAEAIFSDIHDLKPSFDLVNNTSYAGFQKSSADSVQVSENSLRKDKNMPSKSNDEELKELKDKPAIQKQTFENTLQHNVADPVKNGCMVGFQKASGKSIQISEDSLNKAKNIFSNLDDIKNENLSSKPIVHEQNFHTSNLNRHFFGKKSDEISIQPSTEHIEDENNVKQNALCMPNLVTSDNNSEKNLTMPGFSNASGKRINISENSLKRARSIFDNLNMDDDLQPPEKVSKTDFNTRDKKIEPSNLQEETIVSETSTKIIRDVQKSYIGSNSKPFKRKLGLSHCKQIQICDDKLIKARSLFDKELPGISPIKPLTGNSYTSTPIKKNISTDRHNSLRPIKIFSTSDITAHAAGTADTTSNNKSIHEVNQEVTGFDTNLNILCTSPTNEHWMNDLVAERKKLEQRLQIILEREKLAKTLLESEKGKAEDAKKPRKGILYSTKIGCNRIPLVTFVDNKKPGDVPVNFVLPINPKNAENLHFKDQDSASIMTEDGAVIIPNLKNMVGLTEIKVAFQAMPGVEPRLIPKGWIPNHFKWIVWKLASYENMFPHKFKGCLNIENIMQQLKYRYDREIDRAERPALRKIYEKDDASQKRIILCVSDIKMVNMSNYELQLTDGWYAIRTVIDEPLCNQVRNGKIKIGTKLIISGAQLLNCDGCYPLEATNLVSLKINYNSTRRAVWHAKLGFQRDPNPFSIPLESINPLGGTVASIKVYIMRMYPLEYIERMEGYRVWRNGKAEERAAQKWENERCKSVEQIQDEVRKRWERPCKKQSVGKRSEFDLSNIKCPKELQEIIDQSNDPESLQETLSSSQKEIVLNYQSNLSMKKQQEITQEVNENMKRMKLTKRDVVTLLKLLVLDIMSDCVRPFNFVIWQPTEAHLQTIREGKSFTIQNVLPRSNGDLNSNMKTTFKMESIDDSRFSKYKRHLVQLRELVELKSSLDNKFDTVGIVVQTSIESHKQEAWISDNEGRLLFIKIYEGPDTCLALDSLKRGNATSVCNLIYCGLKKDVLHAVADRFTVFSSYSQYKHLQDGLEMFKTGMAKDMQGFLADCDNKIEIFKIISDIKDDFSTTFEDTDADTFS